MTFADWARDTHDRVATHPPRKAIAASLQELTDGARARWLRARHAITPGDTTRTTQTGVTARFEAPTYRDLRRAHTLLDEAAVADWLYQGIDDEDVVWDIGAYHGHYAVLAALHGAEVIAFEPATETRRRIHQHRQLNSVTESVTVCACALGRTARQAALAPEGSGTRVTEDDGATPVRVGDTIEPAPSRVKIDVEGHEVAVLDGLQSHLQGVDRVAIEVHDGVADDEVGERLEAAGLAVEQIDGARGGRHLAGFR